MDSSFVGKKEELTRDEKTKAEPPKAEPAAIERETDILDSYAGQNLDKNELFQMFKENEGAEYVEAIKKNVVNSKLLRMNLSN
jgi:hypothetical protein